MLPFILCVPIATGIATVSASKFQIPPIYTLAVACALQIIGTALFSTIGVDVPPKTYGFETILGIGIGLNVGSVVILTPNIIKGKDQCPCLPLTPPPYSLPTKPSEANLPPQPLPWQ